MVTIEHPPVDGALGPVLERLRNAVHSLVDPVPVWDHGVCRWSDALYVRLRGALQGSKAPVIRRRMPSSRTPCRIDVLALVVAIDTTAAGWEPDGKGTVERLRQLAAHGWRPQDCERLDDHSDRIEAWTLQAVKLLGDRAPAVALRLPCPACGSRFVHRRSGSGESVRSWALRVSEDGCVCLSCEASWSPDQFHWLARLLGCEPLPA